VAGTTETAGAGQGVTFCGDIDRLMPSDC
jgi:hypothetical protein